MFLPVGLPPKNSNFKLRQMPCATSVYVPDPAPNQQPPDLGRYRPGHRWQRTLMSLLNAGKEIEKQAQCQSQTWLYWQIIMMKSHDAVSTRWLHKSRNIDQAHHVQIHVQVLYREGFQWLDTKWITLSSLRLSNSPLPQRAQRNHYIQHTWAALNKDRSLVSEVQVGTGLHSNRLRCHTVY